MKWFLFFIFLLLLVLITYLVWANGRPAATGVMNGHLGACPGSPNCVSSRSADPIHAIAPFPGRENAIADLSRIIRSLPRTTIVSEDERYLHALFRSELFRFIDDVELYLNDANEVEVRSASRCGYSDWGVNRERVEHLRAFYQGENQ